MLNEFNFIFNNDQIHIEFDQNGVAWFYGPEIAKVLEYDRARNMYRMLNENEKGAHKVSTLGGMQNIVIINEPGVYRCIFNSRSPRAVEFQNKVFYDILPSIRQYGAYIDPDTRAQLQQDPNYINNLVNKITELENKPHNKLMYTLVDKTQYPFNSYENMKKCLLDSEEDITVATLAKILCNSGYPTGEHKLYEELRNDGFLIKYGPDYNMPYQNLVTSGLIKIVKNSNYDPDNGGKYYGLMITPKGVEFFINHFVSKLNNVQ